MPPNNKTKQSRNIKKRTESRKPDSHVDAHKQFIKFEEEVINFGSGTLCGKSLREYQNSLFARSGLTHKKKIRRLPQHMANHNKKMRKKAATAEKQGRVGLDADTAKIHHMASSETLKDVRRKQKFIALRKDRLAKELKKT
ncbi:hypothetical protein P9112_012298 [Eukaryota sp. TZLM1-RC]